MMSGRAICRSPDTSLRCGQTALLLTGKGCRVGHGGGKFTPAAARGPIGRSLIYLQFPRGPALASLLPEMAIGQRRRQLDASQGLGHVSVSQIRESSIRLSAIALAARLAIKRHVECQLGAIRSIAGLVCGARSGQRFVVVFVVNFDKRDGFSRQHGIVGRRPAIRSADAPGPVLAAGERDGRPVVRLAGRRFRAIQAIRHSRPRKVKATTIITVAADWKAFSTC